MKTITFVIRASADSVAAVVQLAGGVSAARRRYRLHPGRGRRRGGSGLRGLRQHVALRSGWEQGGHQMDVIINDREIEDLKERVELVSAG